MLTKSNPSVHASLVAIIPKEFTCFLVLSPCRCTGTNLRARGRESAAHHFERWALLPPPACVVHSHARRRHPRAWSTLRCIDSMLRRVRAAAVWRDEGKPRCVTRVQFSPDGGFKQGFAAFVSRTPTFVLFAHFRASSCRCCVPDIAESLGVLRSRCPGGSCPSCALVAR